MASTNHMVKDDSLIFLESGSMAKRSAPEHTIGCSIDTAMSLIEDGMSKRHRRREYESSTQA